MDSLRRFQSSLRQPLNRGYRASARLSIAGNTVDMTNLRQYTYEQLSESLEDGSAFAVRTRDARAPRLLDRQARYRQSSGRLNIRRESSGSWEMSLRWSDPFHSIVSTDTPKLVGWVLVAFVLSWMFFGILFRMISYPCGLNADTYLKAVYLAIETIETIGYGVDDSFFHDCYEGVIVLSLSAIWESVFNAALISVVCARLARANPRATSVVFSEKAIITEIDGHWYFMFQVCDFRKHQLCEAHVRMYSIQHSETHGGINFQTRTMRLQQPDDELGGMLLLAIPQVVVHRIDSWSPLCPTEHQRPMHGTPANSFCFPEIPQRAADGENGNRDPYFRPPGDTGQHATKERFNTAGIARHLAKEEFEVLCVVEGIEATTSSTMQARHSYTCDDIVFNAAFHRCVGRTDAGRCKIDFDRFHDLVCSDGAYGCDKPMHVQSMP